MLQRSFDLVVVGGSAGTTEALLTILSALPRSFAAPIVVVLHRAASDTLSSILPKWSALPVRTVRHNGGELLPGAVHLAPAGCHVLVGRGPRLVLWDGPTVHGFKPAFDPLFHSAARVFRERLLAVILNGAGQEGSTGARAVKDAGGIVLAQDEHGPREFGTRESARAGLGVSHVLPVLRIAPAIHSLVSSGSFEAW